MLSECRFERFIKIPANDLEKVEENFQILFGLAHLGSPPIIGVLPLFEQPREKLPPVLPEFPPMECYPCSFPQQESNL